MTAWTGCVSVLETLFPRMKGHTIVIFKPHREDISEINGRSYP